MYYPLFIISGPSGVGKTALIKKLRTRFPQLGIGVTYTTRRERAGKKEDKIMRYISHEHFKKLIHTKALAEWARVHGEYYGTARTPLEKHLHHGPVILNIDVQGTLRIKKKIPDAILIFIRPQSLHDLQRRILRRGAISSHELVVRLRDARKEMSAQRFYAHRIVNREGHIKETVAKITDIIEQYLTTTPPIKSPVDFRS